MSTTKRILCLANSRKLSGRCIAGREISQIGAGPWVRPVSDRPSQEVSEDERRYEDGSDPKVLDVIDVPLIGHCPDGYHSENWCLDAGYYWVRAGRMPLPDLPNFVDPVQPLWIDDSSTYHGLNDKMSLHDAEGLNSSLTLIRVPELHLRVFAPNAAFGDTKRRVQASFAHAGSFYRLRVTDPELERRFLAQPDGEYLEPGCYLTISLSEPFNGDVYKLVAAVIETAA